MQNIRENLERFRLNPIGQGASAGSIRSRVAGEIRQPSVPT